MTTTPKLLGFFGPAEGRVFTLSEDEVSIGRDPTNLVCINDHSISRQHCVIRREGESFKIIDMESYNGTFVNAERVSEHTLQHSDQIAVGSALFLFLIDDAEAQEMESRIELSDDDPTGLSTIRLERKDALYLKAAAVSSGARVARDLDALLKISTSLSKIRALVPLQRALLENVLNTIPADRGAILLIKENSGELIASYSLNRKSQTQQPIVISRSVTEKVMREGIGLLCVDTRTDEALREAESLLAAQVRSLLCAPLIAGEHTHGLIYLDTSNPAIVLDEDHLQLLTAVGSIAAVAIENVRHVEWLQAENERLHQEINLEHNMIGNSPRMREVFRLIEKIAPADATVLIRGESGSGKELVAHAIHHNSGRAAKQFVAINCAVLSETLLESELFGYEKGAFTGAVAQKRGRLEVADGGTLFLDEVGELTSATQAKLLRVLQERQFERVGGTRTIEVDVRVIAATNRDLEEAIRAGTFRQDLYYRLNVISLTLPALRERREDVPLLAYHFVNKYSKKCKRLVNGISPAARNYLLAYDWPGNVRELENAIERAVVLGNSDLVMPDDLPEALLATAVGSQSSPTYHEAVNEMKKQFILRALEQSNGNYTEAAKLLGIHPTNLHRLIRTMGLRGSINSLQE